MKILDLSRIPILSTKFMLIHFEKPALTVHLITEKLTLCDFLKAAQENRDRNMEKTQLSRPPMVSSSSCLPTPVTSYLIHQQCLTDRQQMCCFSPNRFSSKGRRKTLDPSTSPRLDPVAFAPGGSLQPGVPCEVTPGRWHHRRSPAKGRQRRHRASAAAGAAAATGAAGPSRRERPSDEPTSASCRSEATCRSRPRASSSTHPLGP